MEGRRLYRSRRNRIFLGTVAGIAGYFAWDPALARTLFLFATVLVLSWNPGAFILWVLAYFATAFLIPLEEPA